MRLRVVIVAAAVVAALAPQGAGASDGSESQSWPYVGGVDAGELPVICKRGWWIVPLAGVGQACFILRERARTVELAIHDDVVPAVRAVYEVWGAGRLVERGSLCGAATIDAEPYIDHVFVRLGHPDADCPREYLYGVRGSVTASFSSFI